MHHAPAGVKQFGGSPRVLRSLLPGDMFAAGSYVKPGSLNKKSELYASPLAAELPSAIIDAPAGPPRILTPAGRSLVGKL